MNKKILIDARYEIVRTAIVEDGRLMDFHEEDVSYGQLKGNIYRGVVRRVESSLQASFVDIGENKNGFLQMRDVHKKYYPERSSSNLPRIQEIFRNGDGVLVQVARDSVGKKGPVLTTHISLPGRYLVLMPESEGGGISQKIKDEKSRAEMRAMLDRLASPTGAGVILRTAALSQTKRELDKDLNRLIRLWNEIRGEYGRMKRPGLLYKDQDVVVRCLRDYFTSDIREVLINDPEAFDVAREYFRRVMPRHGRALKLYKDTVPLFDRYNIEEEIARSHEPIVPLPSGGTLFVEPTEALVSIDVNTGRATSGTGLEETVTRTNLEAAEEVARQLRLRDLGGLIVVDFIDMANPANRRRVERRLRESLRGDKARTKVGGISPFGLLQLTRQRLRISLGSSTHVSCPECNGRGWVISNEVICLDVLRRLSLAASKARDAAEIRARVNSHVALHLLNARRNEIKSIEEDFGVRVVVEIGTDTRAEVVDIKVIRGEKGGIAIARQRETSRREGGSPKAESVEPAQRQRKTGAETPGRRRRRRRPAAAGEGTDESTGVGKAGKLVPEKAGQVEPAGPVATATTARKKSLLERLTTIFTGAPTVQEELKTPAASMPAREEPKAPAVPAVREEPVAPAVPAVREEPVAPAADSGPPARKSSGGRATPSKDKGASQSPRGGGRPRKPYPKRPYRRRSPRPPRQGQPSGQTKKAGEGGGQETKKPSGSRPAAPGGTDSSD